MIKVAMKQTMETSADVSNAKTIRDFTAMRPLSLLICAVVFVSACGHKKVQVRTPQASAVSSSDLEGLASYYAEPYHGRRTANGEIFDTYQGLTAAHRTLPFNTVVRVTNKTNGREVDVKINDRGPLVEGRVIDLSLRAARQIDLVRPGIAPVKLKILQAGNTAMVAVAVSSAIPGKPLFTVQVGAFENERAAENLKKRLEKKYSPVTVQTFAAEKTVYRVRIGQEPTLDAAEKLAAELKKESLRPFVVRMN
jgi:rare lipoprotein A